MTTRSQKRKAVAELATGDFETPVVENNSDENLIAGPSKNPRKETENLEEIKTSLRKEIMTDLTKILAENQKEIFKLIAPLSKKLSIIQESDSEPEDVPVARTSTPVKTNTATGSKITPVNSRNMVTGVFNDSTNQPMKRPKQQRASSEQTKDRPSTSKILFAPQLVKRTLKNSDRMLVNALSIKHPHPLSKYSTLMPNKNNHLPRTPYVSKSGTTPSKKLS